MTKVINLRRARKAKARAAADRRAQENRIKFGRTKSEKGDDAIHSEKLSRRLDQARLDTDT